MEGRRINHFQVNLSQKWNAHESSQFLDENWSMARLNVHVAPRHASLHVVSSDFLDFDIIPTCHKKKHVNISCLLC